MDEAVSKINSSSDVWIEEKGDYMTITIYVPSGIRKNLGGMKIQGIMESISVSKGIGFDDKIDISLIRTR